MTTHPRLFAGVLSLAGLIVLYSTPPTPCHGQSKNAALSARSKASVRLMSDASADSSQQDPASRDTWLVQQIVPIESRGVSAGLPHGTLIEDLTPVVGQRGVVVCEPCLIGKSEAVATFGAACGDWLNLIVAGQPQFGQTPPLQSLDRAREEVGGKTLALNVNQARSLYRIVGADTVAVGTIRGNANHCVLSYQTYVLPATKTIGPLLAVKGSEESILAQLPALARRLAVELGVSAPQIPTSVGTVRADDFVYLGRIERISSAPANNDSKLANLAHRTPLAGVLYLSEVSQQSQALGAGAAKKLLAQLPNNALVYADIGWVDASALLPYRSLEATKYASYPKSSLFAVAQTYVSRISFDPQAERKAAERTVCCAWHSPDSWLTLAYTISDDANRVRHDRWSDMISVTEESYIDDLYDQWLRASVIAVQHDPTFGKAWLRTATAATFAGNGELADQALKQALRLDPNHAEVYDWGLEMYQPKWSDLADNLAKLADRAASDKYESCEQAMGIYDELNSASCPEQANRLMTRYTIELTNRIARKPADGAAHAELAICYFHEGLYLTAATEYQTAAHLLPKSAIILFRLGETYDRANRPDQAISAFRAGLHLDPQNGKAHSDLAFDLMTSNQSDAALSEFQQALKIDPFLAKAHYGLGCLYQNTAKTNQAISEYRKAIRYQPYLTEAYTLLAALLNDTGQYEESVQIAEEALVIYPEHRQFIPIVEDDYIHLRQYDRAISICNLVLQAYPDDLPAHENLAEAYIGKGDKAHAIAEWHIVSQSSDEQLSAVAKGYLSQYR
ncbi:MAG TPA: tetratricopeptide repeat protein [Capsulimonadaceae bacterium]|nr:tetratricopeptide repeat protein [Capsulimonadaceae bacterium]